MKFYLGKLKDVFPSGTGVGFVRTTNIDAYILHELLKIKKLAICYSTKPFSGLAVHTLFKKQFASHTILLLVLGKLSLYFRIEND